MTSQSDIAYIKKEYDKIRNLFSAGQFKKVIEKTKILLIKDPSQATFYNYLGLSYSHLRKPDIAEKFLLKGLEVHPNNMSLLVNLGSVLRVTQDFDGAEKALKKVLEQNPNHFTALCNLANLKRDLNKDHEATKLYEKAYKIDKTNVTLLANLSITYQTIGDFNKCKKILEEMEILSPKKTIQDKIYSSFHKYSENDEHQKLMITKSLDTKIQNYEKINLYFSL